jgi:hypothetical protein
MLAGVVHTLPAGHGSSIVRALREMKETLFERTSILGPTNSSSLEEMRLATHVYAPGLASPRHASWRVCVTPQAQQEQCSLRPPRLLVPEQSCPLDLFNYQVPPSPGAFDAAEEASTGDGDEESPSRSSTLTADSSSTSCSTSNRKSNDQWMG